MVLGAILATLTTVVGFDAVEYVAFTTVGKQFKTRGANQMITVNDFIKAAQAKKIVTMNASTNIVEKAKEIAVSAKEAVVSIMPANNKSVDKLAEITAVLIAAMEQRLDHVEEQVGSGVDIDPELLTERVSQILSSLNPPKPKKEKQQPKPSEVDTPVNQETLAAALKAEKPPVQGKRLKLGGRFETPDDWSNIPTHG